MKIIAALLLNLATLVCLAAAPDTVRFPKENFSKDSGSRTTLSSIVVNNTNVPYLTSHPHGSMILRKAPGVKRKRFGRILTFTGPVAIWAGVSLLKEARRQKADFDPATPLGIIGTTVGILATGTGIVLWYSGSRAYKRHQHQKTNLAFSGRGVALIF
jgi:hypothetical protein